MTSEGVAGFDAERLQPVDLMAAQRTLDQIRELVTGERETLDGLNPLARDRILAVTDAQRIRRDRLAKIAEVIWMAPSGEQIGLAYYLAGFPSEAVEFFGEMTAEDAYQRLHAPFETKEKQVRQTIGRASLHLVPPLTDRNGEPADDNPSERDLKDIQEEEDELDEVLGGVRLSGDPVKDYLHMIGKTPLLTAQDEVELAQQIEVGVVARQILEGNDGFRSVRATDAELRQLVELGEAAQDRFIQSNLRLVVSIAKHHTGRGLDFLELIQEGNTGLIHAVEKFDYKKGLKFSTYASWWIKQSMIRALADKGRAIRLPVYVHETVNRVRAARYALAAELGHQPTDDELVRLSPGITQAQVTLSYQSMRQTPDSLDRQTGDDETTLGDILGSDPDQVPTEEQGLAWEKLHRLQTVLDSLPPQEADIIRRRFGLRTGEKETLEQIATMYGLTRERIRQVEAKALSKLRHPARAVHLRGLL